MNNSTKHSQSGVSLIAAIFLLVGLSMLGAMMTLLVTSQSESTLDELYAAQALYAAQSAVQGAAFKINQSAIAGGGTANCTAANTVSPVQLEAGTDAWFEVTSSYQMLGTVGTCKIVATGYAGGTSANPITQRQLTVVYKPATLP